MAIADRSGERGGQISQAGELARHAAETVRRAFVEFLTIPSLVIGGFLLLALVTYVVDGARGVGAGSKDAWGGLFSDAEAARGFLGVIAGSIITVTSITFSLLLIAVQQGAAALTSLVFDQFLRRRANQLYFGFFIGLALYSLIVLASINPSHQPIHGVALAGLMTAAALYMLILLIYTTIDQMRPVVIIQSIHDYTLTARLSQLKLLQGTRRAPRLAGPARIRITAHRGGFLTRLDFAALGKAAAAIGNDAEIVILFSIGDFVAFGDALAEVRTGSGQDASALQPLVRAAVVLEEQRDLDTDPAFGIEQLGTIGWTSISTAKSNPNPGLLAIFNLRDLLGRWLATEEGFGTGDETVSQAPCAVVYVDNVPEQLLRALESLAVVATESMQHQGAAALYLTFAGAFPDLPQPLQEQAERIILHSLSGLGDHILTADLDASLATLAATLDGAGRARSAAAILAAREGLASSIGELHSRSTRTDAAAPKG